MPTSARSVAYTHMLILDTDMMLTKVLLDPGYILEPDCNTQANKLRDSGRFFYEDKYKDRFNNLFNSIGRWFGAMGEDPVRNFSWIRRKPPTTTNFAFRLIINLAKTGHGSPKICCSTVKEVSNSNPSFGTMSGKSSYHLSSIRYAPPSTAVQTIVHPHL